MELCTGYHAILVDDVSRVVIVKQSYIKGNEISKLFDLDNDTKYTHKDINKELPANGYTKLQSINHFESHDNSGGG